MNLNNLNIYVLMIIQLIIFSCKDSTIINLEAAIDQYLYLKNQTPLNKQHIEQLKSQFEKLDVNNLISDYKVTRLYYLSEISLMQNKPHEAYQFISDAYALDHADSIYKQREKIHNMIIDDKRAEIDSTNTNLIWFSDVNNKLLMFDVNKTHYSSKTEENEVEDNLKINQVIDKGRAEVQSLYNNQKYEMAINKAQTLIMVLNELNKNQKLNTELAQLYQDLAILYAKQNQMQLAKEAIKKAIELNPSAENKEIENLISK